jgi:hypothetical protein
MKEADYIFNRCKIFTDSDSFCNILANKYCSRYNNDSYTNAIFGNYVENHFEPLDHRHELKKIDEFIIYLLISGRKIFPSKYIEYYSQCQIKLKDDLSTLKRP